MEPVRADTDFRAQAKLEPVVEPGARVHHHRGRIHLPRERLRRAQVAGDDRVGVVRAVSADVSHRVREVRDHLHGDHQVEVLGAVVVLGRGRRGGHALARFGAPAQFDALRCERLGHARQERVGDRGVDEQALGRVARARPLALRVHHDPLGHFQVGRGIDVHMTHAVVVLQHRHFRFRRDPLNQRLAAARDREVDVAVHRQQVADRLPVGGRDELNRVGRNAAPCQFGAQECVQCGVGVNRLLAAAEDHRVAALDAQRGGVHRHVRPRLVDEEHHAERHADLQDL